MKFYKFWKWIRSVIIIGWKVLSICWSFTGLWVETCEKMERVELLDFSLTLILQSKTLTINKHDLAFRAETFLTTFPSIHLHFTSFSLIFCVSCHTNLFWINLVRCFYFSTNLSNWFHPRNWKQRRKNFPVVAKNIRSDWDHDSLIK